MHTITVPTNRRLHKLLNETNLSDMKPELVKQYSSIRATSSKDLLENEARELCKYLEALVKPAMPEPVRKAEEAALPPHLNPDRCDVMRKKIFSLCRSMGYIYGFTEADKAMNKVVVYGMVERRGKFKKPLMKHTQAELVELVSQFESWAMNNNRAEASGVVRELLKELKLETAR